MGPADLRVMDEYVIASSVRFQEAVTLLLAIELDAAVDSILRLWRWPPPHAPREEALEEVEATAGQFMAN